MNTNTSASNAQNWKQIAVAAVVFAVVVAIVLYFLSVPTEQIVIAVPISTLLYFVFSRLFTKLFTNAKAN